MVEYFDNFETACYEGYSFRRDKHTGYFLSASKIGDHRKRLHVFVWETANGREVPKGYHIHHIDGDKNNNEPENLALLTAHEHELLHAGQIPEERKARMRKILLEKAVPASKEWHRSEEGLEWHRQHGKDVFGNMSEIEYICSYCGKPFKSKHHYPEGANHFCSNNCKSAFRRKSGLDDIVKVCEVCGGEYTENKYIKTTKCKNCRHKRN